MAKKKMTFKEYLDYWDKTNVVNTHYMLSQCGFDNKDEKASMFVDSAIERATNERDRILMMYLECKKGRVKRLMKMCDKGSKRYYLLMGAYMALHNVFCEWRGLSNKGSVYEVENGKI